MSERDTPIDDQWYTRDLPVLREAARQAGSGTDPLNADTQRMAHVAGTDADGVNAALTALADADYLSLIRGPGTAGGPGTVWGVTIHERGRRTVGIWPNQEEPVERLLQALKQAEDHTSDPDERADIAKAWRYISVLPRDVMAEVLGTIIGG